MKDQNEIKLYSKQELIIEEKKSREELQKLRFRSILGYVENPLKRRLLRRRIARILTRLHEIKGA